MRGIFGRPDRFVRNAHRAEGVMLSQLWLPKAETEEGLAALAARQRR